VDARLRTSGAKTLGDEHEWSGGGGWILSTMLLGLGVLIALAAIGFALVGSLDNGGEPASQSLVAAATPLALSAIALIGVGGVLRYCCYCDWDCDWDEEKQLVQIQK
jgi:hypothetical protein